MKKIISLFQRNYDGDRLVRDEVVPGAEWVVAGEGVATVKYDGTCCMVRNGKLYKRYDAKAGRTPPPGFEPAEDEPNEHTGHWPGWLPVGDGNEDRWHRQAFGIGEYGPGDYQHGMTFDDGTYELIGPKVQGNPYHRGHHVLVPHGSEVIANCPRDYAGIRAFLAAAKIEGIVWHHADGRMCKVKSRDFGIKWQD